MRPIASQITSFTIVYSTVYTRCRSKKTRKLRVTVLFEGKSSHKGAVTRKMFPIDDVIILPSNLVADMVSATETPFKIQIERVKTTSNKKDNTMAFKPL